MPLAFLSLHLQLSLFHGIFSIHCWADFIQCTEQRETFNQTPPICKRLGKWRSQLCGHIAPHFANTTSWLLIALKAHGFGACKMAALSACIRKQIWFRKLVLIFFFFLCTSQKYPLVLSSPEEQSHSWEILAHFVGLKPLPWNKLDYCNIPEIFVYV